MADSSDTAASPHITVRSEALRHGSFVVLALGNLQPRERVAIEAVGSDGGDVVRHSVRADAQGRVDTALPLPERHDAPQHWTFAATSPERGVSASTDAVLVLPSR
jgi:hypothetical protein